MDISVTIIDFELKFYMCNPNIAFEGSLSHNFDLGHTFYFMTKKRVTFGYFSLQEISTFHKIETRTYIKIFRHAPLHLYLKKTRSKFQSSICDNN